MFLQFFSLSDTEDIFSIVQKVLKIFVNTNKLEKQFSDEVKSLQYIDKSEHKYKKLLEI